MVGTIISFITDLAYSSMIIAIIVLSVYAIYLFDQRKKRNDAIALEMGEQNWITNTLIKIRELGKKVRER